MKKFDTDLEPQPGFALVERKTQEKSTGGIIVPDTADQTSMVRFYVVASSAYYLDHGTKVESSLQPGDEVVIAPNGKSKRLVQDKISGKPMEVEVAVQRLMHSPLAPDDCFIVLLSDVACRVPAEKVQPIVGGKPKLAIVERAH